MNKINKSFKHSLIAIALGAIGMGCMTLNAAEPQVKQVMIKVEKNNDKDAVVDLKVDGVNEVFSLPELAVGETRSITTESGKEITLSKSENGLSLVLDGKTIDLPGVGGNLAAHIQRSMPLHQNLQDTIQISGVELDENQKQIIKNAFISAGIDKKVSFSNHKIMLFSTNDDIEMKTFEDLKSYSRENPNVEIIIDSDSKSEVEVYTIDIEGSDDN